MQPLGRVLSSGREGNWKFLLRYAMRGLLHLSSNQGTRGGPGLRRVRKVNGNDRTTVGNKV